jgi:hypothetical protein
MDSTIVKYPGMGGIIVEHKCTDPDRDHHAE